MTDFLERLLACLAEKPMKVTPALL